MPMLSADRQIQVRIGIHMGDVVHRGGDVYGDGVNIASRIEPVAGTRAGFAFRWMWNGRSAMRWRRDLKSSRPTELKNISVPMDLFRIVLPWERQTDVCRQSPKSESSPVDNPKQGTAHALA